MDNKYLSYGPDRAPRVREMFSRLAWRYDLVNDIMSFGLHRWWKRQTVDIALKKPAGGPAPRVLDLCCGSGDLCFLAEERGAGEVVGVDFTLPMLAVARRRQRDVPGRSAPGRGDGRRGPQFVQADALALPFPDASFDAVTISYGLRNIADMPRALVEMRRVLAPGGRAVVLDFGKPDNWIVGALYGGFLRTMMPAVGWLFHGDPETYLYIPASLRLFPAQRGVESLMRQAGFSKVRYENRLLGTMGINVGEA
ncbi:MAG TPA: ubiquinone/menaquinone biosynthesis methyltransferase [Thermoanaerobaculia bacterium]|nr:ubiquinone/menaquinone biosynthesis methyltransferase [Thermoanaerobaculia bacterium]